MIGLICLGSSRYIFIKNLSARARESASSRRSMIWVANCSVSTGLVKNSRINLAIISSLLHPENNFSKEISGSESLIRVFK